MMQAVTPTPPLQASPAHRPAGPMTPDIADLPARAPGTVVLATRAVAVSALLGLIGLGLGWELWWAPTGARWLVLKVLPLLIPLAGLLKHRLYTYRWLSLLVWLYFTEGIVRATGLPEGADGGRTVALAWGQVVLCVVLFIACTAHVRWRLKHPLPSTGLPT